MACYLGQEGYCVIHVVLTHSEQQADDAPVDFIIKWNPRKEDPQDWLNIAEEQALWNELRPGNRVGLFDVGVKRRWNGYEYTSRRILCMVERTLDKQGQHLVISAIEMEGRWTSLSRECQEVIDLFADHGTSEQFHSELKIDMDIERMPSGKFAINALVLACLVQIYNILRWIGQNGLTGPDSPPGIVQAQTLNVAWSFICDEFSHQRLRKKQTLLYSKHYLGCY
jgi:hypothetical protein